MFMYFYIIIFMKAVAEQGFKCYPSAKGRKEIPNIKKTIVVKFFFLRQLIFNLSTNIICGTL